MPVKPRCWVGWREWLALPELGISAIKAKIDTGARNSALHAFNIKLFTEHGQQRVRFIVHPLQKRKDKKLVCHADVLGERWVSDSSGHREHRLVIRTPVRMGDQTWPIEITLTNRDAMTFRMLLGRSALHNRLLIDPDGSYLASKPPGKRHAGKVKGDDEPHERRTFERRRGVRRIDGKVRRAK